VSRRREVDEDETVRLLERAQESETAIERIAFPHIGVRAGLLRGVVFVDCDVARLDFMGRPFRKAQIVDCRFIRCDSSYHVRYHGVQFIDCAWEDGELSGSIQGTHLRGCKLDRMTLDEVVVKDSVLDTIGFRDVTIDGLIVQDSILRDVAVSGKAHHLNMVDVRADNVDLSGLHAVDAAFDGIAGHARFPDFPDSFVVAPGTIASLEARLRELVRPEATPTLGSLLSDNLQLLSIDRRRLDAVLEEGQLRLTPKEQREVLRLLWEHRVTGTLSSEQPAPAG
jgi:hypothetical protein